ncbi:diguanylate cyclase [Coriobacteriia bacterium Es71-Z0120]|uniref:diguanylate cyclase n=1 Tax=Parvivirga hydrogeniphila TaxID=2939460 RepID=UPI002260A34C|nr:diguanylate cyclase [Parvivirga hydrogeniphila]MCL4078338.1 diguanylate cyclase [Parvivirga hydrogeniphila]
MGEESTAGRTGQRAEARGPLIFHEKSSCTECWGCVRVCPVKAIRVLDGRSEVIQEKCIACGLCVGECGAKAHQVRDDTPGVWELLRSRRTVVALLASEFIAALHPMTPLAVERALAGLGFASVETTALGEEIVALEYERAAAREASLFTIRSTCPVVVDFVRKYHPALAPALAPIVPPYVAQARLIRSMYGTDVAIVYVGPCYARKDEAFDPELGGPVDAAIDFLELKEMIASKERTGGHRAVHANAPARPRILKQVSLTDGFPREVLASRSPTDGLVHVVRGIPDLDRLLKAIEAGETAPAVIDALNCEGCIDGPAVNPGMSLYAKRNVDRASRSAAGIAAVSTRTIVEVLPSIDLVRSFRPAPVRVPRPSEEVIDALLAEGGFLSRAEVLDCGACGHSTCVEHAEAIFRGESTWEMCFPLQRRRLQEASTALQALVTIDELTGVWNGRALDERLELELARFARYGTPLSLVVLDVDGFGAVNDLVGEAGADDVLKRIAEALASSVRTTDMVARVGGDQFAVLLPGVGKTAAFAVAEKLRSLVRELSIQVGGGYTGDVRVTLSAGVASAHTGTLEGDDLVEAAESALAEAARQGPDQVRIAASG